METREELRRRMLEWRSKSASGHDPAAIRRDIVACAEQRISKGVSRHKVSLELDMAQTTLTRWLEKVRY